MKNNKPARKPYGLRPPARELPPPRRRFWRKPAAWILALALTIVAGTVTAWAGGFFTAVLEAEGISGQAHGERLASDPFVVTSISNTTWSSGRYVLSDAAAAEAAVFFAEHPGGQGWDEEWLRAHDAVPAGSAKWEIELEGKRTDKVEIADIEPVVVGGRCRDTARGSLILQEAAGSDPKIPMLLDLDKTNPRLQELDPETYEPSGPFFDYKKITLAKDENVALVIAATVTEGYCEWTFQVDYTADGRRTSTELRAPGDRPFALTGVLDYPSYRDVFLSPLHCYDHDWTRVSGPMVEDALSEPDHC
jgi:hypothetical protein